MFDWIKWLFESIVEIFENFEKFDEIHFVRINQIQVIILPPVMSTQLSKGCYAALDYLVLASNIQKWMPWPTPSVLATYAQARDP